VERTKTPVSRGDIHSSAWRNRLKIYGFGIAKDIVDATGWDRPSRPTCETYMKEDLLVSAGPAIQRWVIQQVTK
jgi:hypothetical protein